MEASLRPISPFTNPRLKALFMLVHEEKDGRSVEQNTLLAFLRSTLTKDASSSHLHHFGEFARGLVFLGVLADADGVLDEDDGICYDDVKENASKDFEDIRKELYDIFSKDSPDCPSFLVHLRHLALPQDYSSHQRRGLRIIWRTIFYDFKWFTSGRDSDLTDPLQSQDTMEIDLDDDSSNSSEDEREEDYDGDTSNISQSQDSTMSDPDNGNILDDKGKVDQEIINSDMAPQCLAQHSFSDEEADETSELHVFFEDSDNESDTSTETLTRLQTTTKSIQGSNLDTSSECSDTETEVDDSETVDECAQTRRFLSENDNSIYWDDGMKYLPLSKMSQESNVDESDEEDL